MPEGFFRGSASWALTSTISTLESYGFMRWPVKETSVPLYNCTVGLLLHLMPLTGNALEETEELWEILDADHSGEIDEELKESSR